MACSIASAIRFAWRSICSGSRPSISSRIFGSVPGITQAAPGLCRSVPFPLPAPASSPRANHPAAVFAVTFRFRCACGYFRQAFLQFAQRLAGRLHDAQDLQRADDAVARGAKSRKIMCPLCSPPRFRFSSHHFLDDVTIAHLRAKDLSAVRRASASSSPKLLITVATSVFCASWPAPSKSIAAMARISSPSTISPFSSHNRTRSASPSCVMPTWRRFPDEPLNFLGMRAAAVGVDVGAVRLVVRDGQLGAEFAQNAGGRFVTGAVRDIDRDVHFFERHARAGNWSWQTRRSGRARRRCGWRGRFSRRRPDRIDLAGEDQLLRSALLDLVVQLVAVVAEKFDAVILVGIVRSGEDDAGIGAERAGDVGHARAWAAGRSGAHPRLTK